MMQYYKYYLSHQNNNRDIALKETINNVLNGHFRRNSIFFCDFFRYADRLHPACLTLQCQPSAHRPKGDKRKEAWVSGRNRLAALPGKETSPLLRIEPLKRLRKFAIALALCSQRIFLLPPTLGCRIAAIAGDWSSLSRMAKKSPVFGIVGCLSAISLCLGKVQTSLTLLSALRRVESYHPNKYASVAQWIRASHYE